MKTPLKAAPQLAILLLLALLVSLPQLVLAEVPIQMALGFSGEIYVARSGTCGELFDHCAEGSDDNPLLAIDVLRAGEEPDRLLVPGTDNATPEGEPTVFFEDNSEILYVVWEGRTESSQSLVNLAWWSDGEWSTVEVSGDREPLKGPPKVSITRDTFEIDPADGGEPTTHQRSVVHVSWSEEAGDLVDFYYTPIIIEDSAYLGANQVFNLSGWDPNPPTEDPIGIPAALLQMPRLTPGREANTVILSFPSPVSERFLSFRAQVVPASLTLLAQLVAAVIPADTDLQTSEDLQALADKIRTHIVDVGYRLHPGVVNFLADEVHGLILNTPAPPLSGAPALSERIRTHIVDVGSRMLDGGSLSTAAPPRVDLLLLAAPMVGGVLPGLVPHVVRLQLVDDRPVPPAGPNQTSFYVSSDGTKSVISWNRKGNIHYRESRGDGWTAVRKIELGGPIDAAAVERILRQRVNDL